MTLLRLGNSFRITHLHMLRTAKRTQLQDITEDHLQYMMGRTICEATAEERWLL